MKLKTKPTDLSRLIKVLDSCKIQYGRAKVEAKDNQTGKTIGTEVIFGSFVFHADTGAYLFSGPVAPPVVGAGPNHKPS